MCKIVQPRDELDEMRAGLIVFSLLGLAVMCLRGCCSAQGNQQIKLRQGMSGAGPKQWSRKVKTIGGEGEIINYYYYLRTEIILEKCM